MIRQCFLKCAINSHDPINLLHNVETAIGRSKLTKIKDVSCSRKQITLKANCENCIVEVKQIGINPSGLNGFAMTKTGPYIVEHGAKIEFLLNSYTHSIEFVPPPDKTGQPKPNNKRKMEEVNISPEMSKKIKVECLDNKTIPITSSTTDIWEKIDNGELYVYTSKGVKSSSKIAAFDMDGTLIKTKSGKVYPEDTKDWQIMLPNIDKKIKQQYEDGFKIVIFTNQAPIGKGKVKIDDFKLKIEAIVKKINVPVQVFIATSKSFYRKPTIGMWKYLNEKKNDGLDVNLTESFYCGDAAGRLANWAPGKKKDHSMADKLFAENLSLKFYTPEQYFLGHSISNVPMKTPDFIPKDVEAEPFNKRLINSDKELLVLVGFPGSGKSFLAKQIEVKSDNKYVTVCRDELGTWQKCASKATELIKQGKSVIVDSTNPDLESRARWTSLAKQLNVTCRCAKMSVVLAHAFHNNKFRELMKTKHAPVADMVFYSYKKKFAEPTPSEGFEEVLDVKFNPSFDDEESEKIYRMHLLEK